LPDEPSQVGFIVSKAIGNAVTRNLVKRRLREIAVETVRRHPHGVNVVVRALAPAATASWGELVNDYQRAFSRVVSRIPGQTVEPPVDAGRPDTAAAVDEA
jgi:ribonuclease P protein component